MMQPQAVEDQASNPQHLDAIAFSDVAKACEMKRLWPGSSSLLGPHSHAGSRPPLMQQLALWELGQRQLKKWTRWQGCSGLSRPAMWRYHRDAVTCLAQSRDATTLVSASKDGTLVVCDAATGRMFCALRGHSMSVNCVVFTPDGRNVISGSDDKTMRVWSLAPLQPPSPPPPQSRVGASGGSVAVTLVGVPQVITTDGFALSMALSGDGRLLATGHQNPEHILLWRVEQHQQASQTQQQNVGGSSGSGGSGSVVLRRHEGCGPMTGHHGGVTFLVMTRDGKTLLSGSKDCTMRVWALPQGQSLRSILWHCDHRPGNGMTMTPDNTMFLTSIDYDGIVRVWDLSTGQQLARPQGGSGPLAVSPDGSTLVSCSNGMGLMAVWDLAAIIRHPAAKHSPHAFVNACNKDPTFLLSSQDGSSFFSGHTDGFVRIWRPSPTWDGSTPLHVACSAGLVDVAKTLLDQGANINIANKFGVTAMHQAVWNGHDTVVRLLQDRGAQVRTKSRSPLECLVNEDRRPEVTCPTTWRHHRDAVTSLTVSRNGTTLVSASRDGTLAVCDAASGRMLYELQEHTYIVTSLVVTPDGRNVLAGADDKSIRVWSLAPPPQSPSPSEEVKGAGAALAVLGEPQVIATDGCVLCMALSDDGRMLATGHGHPHHILLWRVELQQHADSGSGSGSGIDSVALQHHDGCGPLTGHLDVVTCLLLTRDGNRLVSGSQDCTIRVWSLPQSRCLRIIKGHGDWINDLAMVPGDNILVSTSRGSRRSGSYGRDRTVRLWDLSQIKDSEDGGVLTKEIACLGWESYYKVAVSSDGSTLVTCADSEMLDWRQVAMWDLARVISNPAAGHQPRTTAIASLSQPNVFVIASDCSHFFSGDDDGTVLLWRPILST